MSGLSHEQQDLLHGIDSQLKWPPGHSPYPHFDAAGSPSVSVDCIVVDTRYSCIMVIPVRIAEIDSSG